MKNAIENETILGTSPVGVSSPLSDAKDSRKTSSKTLVSDSSKIASVPLIEKAPIKIVRIQPTIGTGGAKTDDTDKAKSIAVIAKSYESLVGKIVELFNNTSVRVVRFVSKNSLEGYKEITGRDEEEKAETIAQHTSLDRTSRDLATGALSRIAARKIENESSLDYIALATVGIDYLSGIATATAELSATRSEIRDALDFIRRQKRDEQRSEVLNGGRS